jgi:hypothetical protein
VEDDSNNEKFLRGVQEYTANKSCFCELFMVCYQPPSLNQAEVAKTLLAGQAFLGPAVTAADHVYQKKQEIRVKNKGKGKGKGQEKENEKEQEKTQNGEKGGEGEGDTEIRERTQRTRRGKSSGHLTSIGEELTQVTKTSGYSQSAEQNPEPWVWRLSFARTVALGE